MGYFTGKTIIITGAGFAALKDGSAGSIGFGIATAFAKEGANLAITGRNVKKLEAAKERLEGEFGIRVLPIQADVNAQADNQAVVQSAVDQVIAEFGRIDALVNNAQASASGVTIADHTTAQFDLALYSGLYAAFYYMQACYPHLKETKGSVVNFASGAGLFGNYGQCAYAAAKEGIRGLTRVAATEWGPDGINANVVCPLAWTAALENFKEQYPEAYEANVHMPPMGHYGNVETEIGRAVVQLCGPDFKFMSGETITLEGGMGLFTILPGFLRWNTKSASGICGPRRFCVLCYLKRRRRCVRACQKASASPPFFALAVSAKEAGGRGVLEQLLRMSRGR